MKLSTLSLPIAIAFSGCLPQPPSEPKVIVSQQVSTQVSTDVSRITEQHFEKPKTPKQEIDPEKVELKRLFNEQNAAYARINKALPVTKRLQCLTSQQQCAEEQTKIYFDVIPRDVIEHCPNYSLNKDTCVDDEMYKRGKVDVVIELYKIGNKCLAEIESCIREK